MQLADVPRRRTRALVLALAGLMALVGAGVVTAAPSSRAFYSDTFYSPSGNIGCRALSDRLRRPVIACTTFNNGRVAYLYRYSRAYVVYEQGQFGFRRGLGPTLAYNQTWRGYGFRCISLVSGMQCENLAGYGFKIAREGVTRF